MKPSDPYTKAVLSADCGACYCGPGETCHPWWASFIPFGDLLRRAEPHPSRVKNARR